MAMKGADARREQRRGLCDDGDEGSNAMRAASEGLVRCERRRRSSCDASGGDSGGDKKQLVDALTERGEARLIMCGVNGVR
ncbi:uncharacterized protein DS421_12g361190 [Arachis hypogaea]|nr:uncharacterized protein DS421_12g361190 [Arachis hypogaea]